MQFTYLLAGWEGSAHDGRVLHDALTKGFEIPRGKYYLADAGYALTSYCLTPYRSTRYHIREWQQCNKRPQNYNELFNLRHPQLRNVIERCFGVVKKRFSILTAMPSFEYKFQVKLTMCTFIVHNFIKQHQEHVNIYDIINPNNDDNEIPNNDAIEDNTNAYGFCDQIAMAMWNDYQLTIR